LTGNGLNRMMLDDVRPYTTARHSRQHVAHE
jgi:hypothetical protein